MREGQAAHPGSSLTSGWARIEPSLPVVPRAVGDHPGRKRLDNRKVLSGILFVLYTAVSRGEFLPRELGFGSGMTCWRRLRDWHRAGWPACRLRSRPGPAAGLWCVKQQARVS